MTDGALNERVCIVTGGARGLGREHSLLLGREGAYVVVNDVGVARDGTGADTTAAQVVVDEIIDAGGVAVASTDSVTDWNGAERIVNTALESFGDLHVLVNNAGILRDRMLVTMTEEEFDSVIAVHLKGTFNMSRFAAAYWREQTRLGVMADRAIVNTSSGAGLHGNPGQTNYAAAKAGIAAMSIVHAAELHRYGVRVNCIAPLARTRLTEDAPGLTELIADHRFDPGNNSPLVAALAARGCPFTGQVFSIFGGTVGIYAGWSIAEEVESAERWTVDGLIAALQTLPREIAVETQMTKMAELIR